MTRDSAGAAAIAVLGSSNIAAIVLFTLFRYELDYYISKSAVRLCRSMCGKAPAFLGRELFLLEATPPISFGGVASIRFQESLTERHSLSAHRRGNRAHAHPG